VDQEIETGALLNLELESENGEKRTILACVVHVYSRGEKDRQLGCNFIHEMSEKDFESLLRVN
jgi:hypothetical protein